MECFSNHEETLSLSFMELDHSFIIFNCDISTNYIPWSESILHQFKWIPIGVCPYATFSMCKAGFRFLMYKNKYVSVLKTGYSWESLKINPI